MSDDGLSSDQDLHDETHNGNHRKSTVLHFIHLILLDLVGGAQVQRVEAEVGAGGVGFLECYKLDDANGDDDLDPSDDGDGVNGLERIGLGVESVGQVHEFLNHHAESS